MIISRMYVVVLLTTLTYLVTCSVGKDDICGILKPWLLSTSISMEMNKKGFHRELVTTVKFGPDVPNGLKVMLIHRWPRGVYVDPYELTSLREHNNLEVLLDSTIDLEAPAHKSLGFVAFVYPSLDEQNPTLVEATVPIHGRYHEPSYDGQQFVLVRLDLPELLLRTDTCSQLGHFSPPHAVVEAPCTALNSSICQWLKIQNQEEQALHVSFQVPVGDGSLTTAVCAGTLVVTLMCCVALSKSIWKHGII